MLKRINTKIEKIGGKKSVPGNATDKLADQVLKEYKAPVAKQKQYSHRLRFGLRNYHARHYASASRSVVDE